MKSENADNQLKFVNNFKGRAFPIINQDKTLTPELTSEPTPEPTPEPAPYPTPGISLINLRKEF